MATLVLSAVGTAVGGPVGGAIGALIGQAVDRRVLGPKRREGPRLTDLAVQTSRYGAQIPQVFGRMRVAGTVIWATDLIETRGTAGGGKGQPGTTSYSYAASFAVLLSARAIAGVGRIWADGTLLRGAAGDLKVAGLFRLHRGGEAQTPDPLIASAEGAATPAHRGCAYAVFEGLALADYGNRIPSLTFEVIAEDGPVDVGTIARAIADTVTGDVAFAVDGFAVAGGSVRAVLDTLAQASGAVFALDGARLMLRGDDDGPTLSLVDGGMVADGADRPMARAMTPADQVPRSVTVTHYDPARDYQAGLQRARRPGAGLREEDVAVPAALSASAAKAVAQGILARAEAQRFSRTLAIGPAALAIPPGTVVTIAGERGRWRVRAVTVERMAGRVALVPAGVATPPVAASSGRVLAERDAVIGATMLAVVETLPLDDSILTAPRLSVVASGGPGWRRAALLYSLDEGASWVEAGATALPGAIGRVTTLPEAGVEPGDPAAAMVVTLAEDHMQLSDAGLGGAVAGGAVAMVGDEVIRFGRATPEGGNRWRLGMLTRGARGTDHAMTTHAVGDRFVLLSPATICAIDLPVAAIGRTVRVMAAGVGDRDGPVTVAVVVTGASVLPPAPTLLTAERQGDGTIALRWVRRSRAGWTGTDGGDGPLIEEREAYVVMAETAVGILRTAEIGMPAYAIPPADIAAGAASVAVAQRGTMGLSRFTRLCLPVVA
ncbi:hypothetical protein ASE75_10740 [Sphingomonas sp. Leaf17]|uniref:phage tail protein n=1 Tax=Sphingomonas sp. Leaf17 TaxID=1735683 RepID=UPI0006FA55BD|nr:phage tail protein [Sphingomonas sp. Leaf17]KQM64433.1 hypothetical protein ASE75_10740 [Sphingomonas sp. Leaf17]